jgi:hypothetical protein
VADPRDPRADADDPGDADERAWQAIVDNYGERAQIDEPSAGPPASDAPFGGRFGDPRMFVAEDADDPYVGREPEDEGYVPPPPPPLPTVAPDRGLAWAGVLGSPVVLLLALIFSIELPTWLGYALIGAFVGGFGYLVAKMPREPRDPWDDGAQV